VSLKVSSITCHLLETKFKTSKIKLLAKPKYFRVFTLFPQLRVVHHQVACAMGLATGLALLMVQRFTAMDQEALRQLLTFNPADFFT